MQCLQLHKTLKSSLKTRKTFWSVQTRRNLVNIVCQEILLLEIFFFFLFFFRQLPFFTVAIRFPSFYLSIIIDLSYLLVFIINVARDRAKRHLFDNREDLIDCIEWLTICCWFFGFFVKSVTLKLVTASMISANSNPSRASTDKSTTLRFDLCLER